MADGSLQTSNKQPLLAEEGFNQFKYDWANLAKAYDVAPFLTQIAPRVNDCLDELTKLKSEIQQSGSQPMSGYKIGMAVRRHKTLDNLCKEVVDHTHRQLKTIYHCSGVHKFGDADIMMRGHDNEEIQKLIDECPTLVNMDDFAKRVQQTLQGSTHQEMPVFSEVLPLLEAAQRAQHTLRAAQEELHCLFPFGESRDVFEHGIAAAGVKSR